ncbi:MAG: hypothetical protein M1377_02660 [Deltaproteobacteria bacterium]|nr:hypothetical protein [Deltaproteobacteria bacterium]
MSHRHYGDVGHCEICGRRSAVLSRCDACGTSFCRACRNAALKSGHDCPIDDCPAHTSSVDDYDRSYGPQAQYFRNR